MNEQVILPIFNGLVFVLLPLAWAWRFYQRPVTDRLGFVASGLALVMFSTYAFQVGQHQHVGWWYLRYLVVAAPFAAIILKSRQVLAARYLVSGGWRSRFRPLVSLVIALPLVWVNLSIANGRTPETEAVHLSLPFHGSGLFLVNEGTSSPWANRHYNRGGIAQRYAVDFAKLESGRIKASLFVDPLEGYHVFGEPLFSPCEGIVEEAVDGSDDNVPGIYNENAGSGNYVRIRCPGEGVIVHMAHLRQGSVAVNNGQAVSTRTSVGEVGNSGFSTEPHLHIQANRVSRDNLEEFLPVPVIWEGRYLTHNDKVSPGR